MATKKTAGDGDKTTSYLSAFEKLGERVYFYHPVLDKSTNGASETATPNVPKPDLIIICSWMAASTRHIAKYTNTYLSHYQHIPILLIRVSLVDLLIKPEQDQLEEMKPAVSAIQSVFASLETAPRVLLHNFSNGGSYTSTVLAKAYQQSTGGLTMPISALILDSCPSLPHMELTHRELVSALPKNFIIKFIGSVLIWLMLASLRVVNRIGMGEHPFIKLRRTLNDPMGPFIKGQVPRVYICSKADKMIPFEEVKLHADDARGVMVKTGLSEAEAEKRVEFEEFKGSGHVGHFVVDAERYWNIVKVIWLAAVRLRQQADQDLQALRARRPQSKV